MDANQQKLTPAQKTTLIDFIHSQPNMQTKRFSATYTKEMSHALWGQIATILNAMPGGAVKDANKWSKTYRDLINNMKKKKSREIKHAQGTGGGPPLLPDKPDYLTTEEKILDILSPTAIEGNIDVPDPAEENNVINESQREEPEEPKVGESVTPKRTNGTGSKNKYRYSKTARLADSIRNNKKFLTLSQKGLDNHEKYREKKLELLNNHYQKKHNYYKDKLESLKSISNSINIVATVLSKEFFGE